MWTVRFVGEEWGLRPARQARWASDSSDGALQRRAAFRGAVPGQDVAQKIAARHLDDRAATEELRHRLGVRVQWLSGNAENNAIDLSGVDVFGILTVAF